MKIKKQTLLNTTILISIITLIIFALNYQSENATPNNIEGDKEKNEINIREPAVSSSFYPSEKTKLTEMISIFLANSENTTKNNEVVLGIIAPHAGYTFSGNTAGVAFKQINGEDYDTVIIIGSSHTTFFKGASVFKNGAYKTPLGNIEIDEDITEKLLKNSIIKYKPEIHEKEHSIEVELPFLQHTLKNEFKIVPIIIGGGEGEDVVEPIANSITKTIKESEKKILVIASSDFSHYPKYEDANSADKKTLSAIETGEVEKLRNAIENLKHQKIENINTFACGQRAIEILMEVMNALDANNIETLDYLNSGDFSENKEKVVGYGAVIFKKEKNDNLSSVKLNSKEKEFLLNLAKNTAEKYTLGEIIETPNEIPEKLKMKLGAFVTLKKNGDLRGCIGVFEPNQPLWKIIQQVAIAATSKDSRFSPVSKEELPKIDYEISVLTPLKKINSLDEIELGMHGVKVEKNEKSGVFLPKVAKETGWDFEKFMEEICTQKMNLEKECYKSPGAKIYIFETEEF